MKRLFLGLLFLVSAARAVDTLSIPTNYLTVTTGTRATLAGNFTSIETWGNKVRDSIAQVTARLGGYTGSLTMTSLANLRLKLDGDNSETARLLVESGNGDSLFTVREDSTAKFYGNLTVNGTSTFTGATTHSALTASLPVFTNGSKVLASNAMTGTGSVVMHTAPTTAGLWTHGGALTVGDSIRLTGRLNIVNAQAETFLTSSTAANPAFIKLTANGAIGHLAKEGTAGTDYMTGGTAGALQLVTATNVPVEIGVNGAKVATFASTGPTFTGTITATTISASGNITGDSLISSKFYTEGTFTIAATNFSGCTSGVLSGSTCTGTAKYTRVGKAVTVFIPALIGTSSGSSLTLTGWPAGISPPVDFSAPVRFIYENSIGYQAYFQAISGTYYLGFWSDATTASTTFTSSGSKGAGAFYLSYTLQ